MTKNNYPPQPPFGPPVGPQQPQPVNVKRDRQISPLWILPLLALGLAAWLVFQAVSEAGQRITIHFEDAAGLIAGRTTIRYQGLEVGIVRDVKLSEDLHSIYVTADIYPEAVQILRKGTRFWLVKPKASITGISGLDALVSGNYIALLPGQGEPTNEFTALDSQPSETPAGDGLTIQLQAPDLGSVSVGAQVYYKKIPVGEVYNYTLSNNKKRVLIDVLIQRQYANLVTNKSRFWNVSGVSANIGFNGVDVQFESLSALIAGAIAFDSPDEGLPIQPNHLFRLYPDLNTAGRGIAITIELPDNNNISAGGAPIIYRGLQIGQISDLRLDRQRKRIIASAAIEPSMSDLLTTGTSLLLEEADLSLNGVKNLGNLIKGNYLTLLPGEGEPSRQFQAFTQEQLEEKRPGAATIQLNADQSYGIGRGTKVTHKGMTVGSVKQVTLDKGSVRFDIIIKPEYTTLVRNQSRFYIDGGIQADISPEGINVSVPPAEQLISNSIAFTSAGQHPMRQHYPLFKNQALARLAGNQQQGSTTIQLFADTLPSVSEGSPVLYRNLPVGQVSHYALTRDGVTIKLAIQNQYRHLITASSVFWNQSGVEVEAGLSGVNIKATPLAALIKGGIAFDSMSGIPNRVGKQFKLFASLKDAKEFGTQISLTASHAKGITAGTNIQYQGVVVGKVLALTPDFKTGQVTIDARLFPQFADSLTRDETHFWLVAPKIDLTGVKNLDSILHSYIEVEPGDGNYRQTFALSEQANETFHGLTVILESIARASVRPGTPLLFRDIQVGQVSHVALGELSDRVLIEAQIEPDFRHLVRTDTVFWNTSGLDVSLGLTGASIQAGTVDTLIRGGIALATPEGQPLSAPAQTGTHFLLHERANPEWKTWRTAIPAE
ncbi:MlaD family protein [Photobacterium galatheae]|uniref:Paraquat-inducible protein B n=1 Tax=Photobacterium galatheae TaxID=1654360 RepID=A0A066RQ95_9GAMM|nr:MlaD family protein [Photobacterium galatheae]KDM91261.1 paraquat-inducible protein B [Photobacterium galatheae]MCM0150340.1 MCE family protein [Photobacterium galatheae]